MPDKHKCVVFWFRRDLRWQDNVGLSLAARSGLPVLPLYVFEEEHFRKWTAPYDRRLDYIHRSLQKLVDAARSVEKSFIVRKTNILQVFDELTDAYDIQAVYANEEYEPALIRRDQTVQEQLQKKGIPLLVSKDQVIVAKEEVQKADGTPYTIYTPYAKRWRQWLREHPVQEHTFEMGSLLFGIENSLPSLEELGFQKTDLVDRPPVLDVERIQQYEKIKDVPSCDTGTPIGMAIRYGTISIRACVKAGIEDSEAWLSQLIWRDFFTQILYHFPHVITESFKPAYDRIKWRNNEEEFERWCQGCTGYPLVDAGMKQLVQTGYMPNRVRMVVASFLCKHLLIDWRWGEVFFAQHLNDYDLALNNGNWQWAAGSGCDAAPYFRIFNPTTQMLRFDKDFAYIQRWNPTNSALSTTPIVVHEQARDRALAAYRQALKGEEE